MTLGFLPTKGTFLNLFLRSASIVARFLLIIYISKAMTLEALGVYNLIAVTVAWSVYLIGFEFYSYSIRQIVGEDSLTTSSFIFNQFLFHLVGFVALFLISPALAAYDFIPLRYIWFFIGITLLDQISQECYRILVALQRSQFANFISFLKSGLWIYPLLLLPLNQIPIDVATILLFWLGGSLIAATMGVLKLSSLGLLGIGKVNLTWIKQGVRISLPFMIITASQLTMDFSDRYLIDYYLDKESVGIYSFFYGIANVPITLITSVLVAEFYPRIIDLYKFNRSRTTRVKTIKSFLFQSSGMAVAFGLGAILLLNPLLTFIEKTALLENVLLFYVMLGHVFIFSVQVVIQTILYAKHEDRYLLISAVVSAVANFILNIFLIPRIGIIGASISTLVSMCLLLGTRYVLLISNNKIKLSGA